MATHRGAPALIGTIRHYVRGFYTVDLVDPDPVHQHLNPMYLRASQFDPGVPKHEGARLVLQFRASQSTGLWCAVAGAGEAGAQQPDLVLRALTLTRDLLGYTTLDEVQQARHHSGPSASHARHLAECDAAEAVLRALATLPQV